MTGQMPRPPDPVRMTGPALRVYTGHLMLHASEAPAASRGGR